MATFMQLPRKQKEYKPRKVQSMDTYTCRSLFRFHDENVSWMWDHFLGENTETRHGTLNKAKDGGVFCSMLVTLVSKLV